MEISHGHHDARPNPSRSDYERSSTDSSDTYTESYSSSLSIIEQAFLRKSNAQVEESRQKSETVAKPEQADQTESQTSTTEISYHGARSDINFRDGTELREIFYSPSAYLQGTLTEKFFLAKRNRRPFIVEASREKIVYFPDRDQFYTSFDVDALRTICTQKMRLIATRTLDKSEEKQIERAIISSATKLIDSDVFLWDVALLTSQGRIPNNADPEAPIRLKLRPDLKRFTRIPHAERIVLLWYKRAASLLETASILKIPQHYVFDFYNATNALRLISVLVNPHKHKPHTKVAEVVRKPRKYQRAFTRIIRR